MTASSSRAAVAASATDDPVWLAVFVCWILATASTLGALFFSEVMNLPPCVLCWYQRIFMMPLVILLPLGLFPFDRRIVRYAGALVLGGWLIALFHMLVVHGVIPESLQPCRQGVSCRDVQVRWLGFITIPLLSFAAFTLMGALLAAARLRSPR